jgi:hypothetical protein
MSEEPTGTNSDPDADWLVAEGMLRRGVPVMAAPPSSAGDSEFNLRGWRACEADASRIASWRPGWALIALTGIAFDVIDVDPRNGGDITIRKLAGVLPAVAGVVVTPGGGEHLYVPPYGGRSVSAGGIDYLAARRAVYLPGTRRPKYGGGGYRWVVYLDWSLLDRPNDGAVPRWLHPSLADLDPSGREPVVCDNPRGDNYGRAALQAEANAVAAAPTGQRNSTLNTAAFRCGQLAAGGHLSADHVYDLLLDAAEECGLVADDGWPACHDTVDSGFRAGWIHPRTHGG